MKTPSKEEISESLNILKDNKQYLLNIRIKGEEMSLNVSDPGTNTSYSKQLTLKEIKEIHKTFFFFNSCNEFLDILKTLSEAKQLSIIKKEDKLSINFSIDYLLKKESIEIDLFSEKFNSELFKDLCNKNIELENKVKELENKNKELENKIKVLEKEIKEIKNIIEPINKKFNEGININKYIFNNNSVIMNEKEFDLIHFALKSRFNKEVKEIKKLYQATIDGDGAINFHSKCDNIPNTLTLIKSAGNRRFGGFTSQTWESPKSEKYKDDKYAFLFSLDKQKIYPYKNNGYAIYCYYNYGPVFGNGHTIYIGKNAIQEKKLYTYESNSGSAYDFYGDKNALSENGSANYIYPSEYEVFQIIFS